MQSIDRFGVQEERIRGGWLLLYQGKLLAVPYGWVKVVGNYFPNIYTSIQALVNSGVNN